MAEVTCEIHKQFTSKRAKQYVKGLRKIAHNHDDGLISDQHLVNSIVQTSLQMLVSAGTVKLIEEDV